MISKIPRINQTQYKNKMITNSAFWLLSIVDFRLIGCMGKCDSHIQVEKTKICEVECDLVMRVDELGVKHYNSLFL